MRSVLNFAIEGAVIGWRLGAGASFAFNGRPPFFMAWHPIANWNRGKARRMMAQSAFDLIALDCSSMFLPPRLPGKQHAHCESTSVQNNSTRATAE